MLSHPNLQKAIQSLRCIAFDFDGVWTDGVVYTNQDGQESVASHRSDSYALRLLKKLDILLVIISTEKNPVVSARGKKLEIEVIQDCQKKSLALKNYLQLHNLAPENTAFVGNDVNDLEAMDLVGIKIAVGDAYPEVKKFSNWVLSASGGKGAIRELCEKIYKIKLELKDTQSPWDHFLNRS